MLSGSYAPGDVYFFRGLGAGRFAERAVLLDVDGQPVRAGLASAVAVTDWDRDGDLDLIVGNIDGKLSIVPQVRRDEGVPRFGEPRTVSAPLRVAPTAEDAPRASTASGDAGPTVADWDGDGVDDLIVGYSDGAVLFYKVVRDVHGAPTLRTPSYLVRPTKLDPAYRLRLLRNPDGGAWTVDVSRSSVRVKPAAFDWNGDGRLDLIVGDVVFARGDEPVLSTEEQKEQQKLLAERSRISREMRNLDTELKQRARRELGLPRFRDEYDAEEDERVSTKVIELRAVDEPYRRLAGEADQVGARLESLEAPRLTRGFVWVYLRKGDAAK